MVSMKDETVIIKNIESYKISFCNGNMILKPETKMAFNLDADFTDSKIKSIRIEGRKYTYKTYKSIINHLFNLFDYKFIIKNSKLKIINGKTENKKYIYLKKLNISYKYTNNNKIIEEIYSLTKMNNIKIKLEIQLDDNKLEIYENCFF